MKYKMTHGSLSIELTPKSKDWLKKSKLDHHWFGYSIGTGDGSIWPEGTKYATMNHGDYYCGQGDLFLRDVAMGYITAEEV